MNKLSILVTNSLRFRLFVSVLLAIVSVSTATTSAQSDTAYFQIYAFFDTAVEGDWKSCARMIHPDDLRKFRREMIEALSEICPSIEAEIEVARSMFGSPSMEAANRMDPVKFFEKSITSTVGMSSDWFAGLKKMDVAVGDFVEEGDTLRHYVFWEVHPVVNSQIEELGVFTLRKWNDDWYCTLSGFVSPPPARLLKRLFFGPESREDVRID